MVKLSSVLPTLKSGVNKLPNMKMPSTASLSNAKKAIGVGTITTALFCVPDFLSVPGAFSMKYDSDGEKVEGTNWKSGFKQLGKSAIKCASYLAIPTAILGMAAGAGPVLAGLAVAGSLGSTFALGSILEEFLPEEQTLVAEACKKKGISFDGVA